MLHKGFEHGRLKLLQPQLCSTRIGMQAGAVGEGYRGVKYVLAAIPLDNTIKIPMRCQTLRGRHPHALALGRSGAAGG